MTDEEMNILFHGKEVVERDKRFQIELNKIEEKNIDYFKSKPPHNHLFKYEKPMDNLMMFTSDGIVGMGFKENCNLPAYIKDEITKAFKKVYQTS